MERIRVEEWMLLIDVPKTKQLYAEMKHKTDTINWLNYIEVCSFIDLQVLSFFEQFGIDILKPSKLSCFPVEEGKMMMYTGSYYLYGERVKGEIDGWDIVIADYCFSLTQEFDAIPHQMSGDIVEISFEVTFPWILNIPIPAT